MAATISAYTSAEPLIALLHDDDTDVQQYALDLLNTHTHEFWSQIAPSTAFIEQLSLNRLQQPGVTDTDEFVQKSQLICSKLYYHMGKHNDALRCVLKSGYLTALLTQQQKDNDNATLMGDDAATAGGVVDINTITDDNVEYDQAMIALTVQTYIQLQRQIYLNKVTVENNAQNLLDEEDFVDPLLTEQTAAATADPRLAIIIEQLIQRGIANGEFITAIGLAVDALRLDWLKLILIKAPATDVPALMKDTFNIAINIVDIHPFRRELLLLLVELYQTSPTDESTAAKTTTTIITTTEENQSNDNMLRPSNATDLHVVSDILALCQCLMALNDSDRLATILTKLVKSTNQQDHLLAYQVAYDLTQNQQIAFTSAVAKHFPIVSTITKNGLGVVGNNNNTTTAKITTATATATSGAMHGINPLKARNATNKPTLPNVEPCDLLQESEKKKTATAATTTTTTTSEEKPDTLTTTAAAEKKDETTTMNDDATVEKTKPEQVETENKNEEVVEKTEEENDDDDEEEEEEIILTDEEKENIVFSNLHNILTGASSAILHNHFLYTNAQSNDTWFKSLSQHPDFSGDNTIAAQVYAGYAIAQCGTHRDGFLRQSWKTFEDLGEWSAFTARAAVGNLYRGQFQQIKDILLPFLPSATNPPNNGRVLSSDELGQYTQGGSLYAMGLAAAGMENTHSTYLSQVLQKAVDGNDEPLQAGAALALGLCGVGSGDMNIQETLREMMWGEQPIAGQAAGIATGLLNIGKYAEPDVAGLVKELLPTAISTQHQNIKHGLGLGLALIYFNAQQDAEVILQHLRYKKKPEIIENNNTDDNDNKENNNKKPLTISNTTQFERWLACWIDAMAYCGTGNAQVLERLLHSAIADPDVDVKRTAILAIAFLLLNEPIRCMEVLEPLSSSYNEHIRYGVAMAIGIVCSSSGVSPDSYSTIIKQGINILEPLIKDKNDIVRQGALIANAMCLQQTTSNTKYRQAIEHIQECFATHKVRGVSAPRVSPVQRIGAALASGIIHAGGMNSNIRLIAPIGNQKRTLAIAGMMLFCNYWHWFPLANMFSLTLSPTGIIGTFFDQRGAIRVPAGLKFVVKVPKLAMQYCQRESDTIVNKVKKQVINNLSKSGKLTAAAAAAAAASSDANGSSTNLSLARSGSFGAPTLKQFASELVRQNSSLKKNKDEANNNSNDNDKTMNDGDDDKNKDKTTTTTTTKTTTLDTTVLQESKSIIDKKKAREERLSPVAVITNNTRLLPRHIPFVQCPKQQEFAPLKQRLFGVVVLAKQPKENVLKKTKTKKQQGETAPAINAFVPHTPGDNISQAEPPQPKEFVMPKDML